MKKTKFLLSAMFVAAVSVNAVAQTTGPWDVDGGGIVQTTTSSTVNIGGDINLTGGIHVSPLSPASTFGAVNINSLLLYGASTFNGNIGASGTLNVTGTAGFGADVFVSGGVHASPGFLSTFGSIDMTGNLTTPGVITVGGNVNISDGVHTAPGHISSFGDVQVVGNITTAGTLSIENHLINMYSVVDIPRIITANSDKSLITLQSGKGGAYLTLHAANETTGNPGALEFIATSKGGGTDFLYYDGTSNHYNMKIRNNGKVVIGSDLIASGNTPDGYNLFVSKGILTEKLKVALSGDASNWSDFVFSKNYKLRSLTDVEAYVNTNKHLPEVPSAKEVVENGIDVASMDAKLLQKIEELTLYMIQQEKRINQQQSEIEMLKKKI